MSFPSWYIDWFSTMQTELFSIKLLCLLSATIPLTSLSYSAQQQLAFRHSRLADKHWQKQYDLHLSITEICSLNFLFPESLMNTTSSSTCYSTGTCKIHVKDGSLHRISSCIFWRKLFVRSKITDS